MLRTLLTISLNAAFFLFSGLTPNDSLLTPFSILFRCV